MKRILRPTLQVSFPNSKTGYTHNVTSARMLRSASMTYLTQKLYVESSSLRKNNQYALCFCKSARPKLSARQWSKTSYAKPLGRHTAVDVLHPAPTNAQAPIYT